MCFSPTADTGGQPVFFDPQRVAQTQAQLARVPDVVDQVLAAVPNAGLDQEEFLESSTVSTTLGSDLLTFSVENSDPRLAMELATEYANAFTEYREQLPSGAGAVGGRRPRPPSKRPRSARARRGTA